MELPLAPLMQRNFGMPLARGAANRRARFASREEALRRSRDAACSRRFRPKSFADYVADGLVEDGKGGFKLACRPAYEAATYCAHRHDPWGALRKRQTDPLVLLRASALHD